MTKQVDICFISSKHPPFDKRVFEKEAVALSRAGFRVVHIAPGEKEGVFRGIAVETYPPPKTLVDRLRQVPMLVRRALRQQASCYHCNEVDSWVVGVIVKAMSGGKLVFDVHELYPAEFAESRFPSVARPYVAGAVRAAIRALIPWTDMFVFAKQSACFDYPNTESRRVIVENFVSVEAAGEDGPRPSAGQGSSRIKLVHLGAMARERGWPELLTALRLSRMEEVDAAIIGEFVKGEEPAFRDAVSAAGLASRVTVSPWLPFREAFRELRKADIGLVLLQPGRLNHVHALPHKLFDYMLAELPIIAPEYSVEVARIVREADCGILIDPSKPAEIAESILRLARDPDERRRLGENGRRAVLQRYNWEAEASKLVRSYEELFRVL